MTIRGCFSAARRRATNHSTPIRGVMSTAGDRRSILYSEGENLPNPSHFHTKAYQNRGPDASRRCEKSTGRMPDRAGFGRDKKQRAGTRLGITLVPTLCVGMQSSTLCVVRALNKVGTQSVPDGIPTQSVGTRFTRLLALCQVVDKNGQMGGGREGNRRREDGTAAVRGIGRALRSTSLLVFCSCVLLFFCFSRLRS